MIIRNVKIRGKEGLYDVETENNRFKSIKQVSDGAITGCVNNQGLKQSSDDTYDAAGRMMMPPFVEPHIHLDCVMTAGIPHYNMSGTLFEGITTWDEYKNSAPLEVEEIKNRAKAALRMMAEYGVQFVRTHVDVTETSFKGVEAILELREEMKDKIEIQTVAFPQNGIMSFRGGKEYMERAMKMGVDCVGGIPHYEFSREMGVESIEFIFDLAEKYDAMIDVHCDEIDDGVTRFLEVMAAEAWKREMGSRTVAAHTCATGSYNDAYFTKLLRALKESGINFNSCPSASVSLDGRFDNYPKRRGITRIRELTEAGLNCALGQDSISDPWYMPGTGNLLRVLEMGMHVEHMTGYKDMSHCLDFISTKGAKNLCIEDHYGIEEGKPASFIILDGHDDYEVFRFQSAVMLSVHNGNLVSHKIPAAAEVTF
ncbi:MAG: cytosine deaminase [Lachnospiraceae bacterium]|nr:cytosine deaminase [Lachnospiraceae bacterium]